MNDDTDTQNGSQDEQSSLSRIIQKQAEFETAIKELDKDYQSKRKGLVWDMEECMRLRSLAANGLDLERINHAEHVLTIKGLPGIVDSNGAIGSAILDLINNGGKTMRTKQFATKNYDRFRDQRCDMQYGYGPRHGSIIFAIGLSKPLRDVDLTQEQIDDAVYLLNALIERTYQPASEGK